MTKFIMAVILDLTMVIMMMILVVDVARIPTAGLFDPFADQNESVIAGNDSNETFPVVNLPSLDALHENVHLPSEDNEILPKSNDIDNSSLVLGPSLDRIDAHMHNDDVNDSSIIDTAKRLLIQPSIDFLDAQMHGGDEHVHDDNRNHTEIADAADLNDFHRWLKEQNETDQIARFLTLQNEVNAFHLDDSRNLTDKLNRTIEELKFAAKTRKRSKHEL